MVEIGTRNGDGISCFSQVASTATAVEISKEYCHRLEARSDELRSSGSHGFQVVCEDYRVIQADAQADIYTCACMLPSRYVHWLHVS